MYDTRERRSAEPAGLRLMSFLAAHGREILDREKDNTASVHLYGAGAYWVAFERSACQMCRLFPQSETAVFRFREFPFPVVMASVEDDRLREYARRHILRSPGPEYTILAVPELSFDEYRRWYRKKVGEHRP